MDEKIDYNNLLENIIKNSINIGYCNPNDTLMKMFNIGKHIIFKTEKKIENKTEKIERFSDIILSIELDKPFRLISNNSIYLTPWIKSIKKYKITIPIVSLPFSDIWIETESDKVIFEHIMICDENRKLLIYKSYMLNTYIDNFLVSSGLIGNMTRNNIWNCRKSHLKKTEKYQKLYKSLSENNKLSPDIINLIIEQQYVIVDPGVCTCLKA
jgi:hypothetical protein